MIDSFVMCFGAPVRMKDDAFNDAGALAELAGALVEVLPARTGAVEHLRRGNVVNGTAKITVGVGVQVK